MEINKIYCEDCLEGMKKIDTESVDMILCDLPYGTTRCAWDIIIPFDKLWEQYLRITKISSPILLFGSEPFSSYLRLSNIKMFKYDWIWEKNRPTGLFLAKKMPMKYHETISVFYKSQCTYIPQMVHGNASHSRGKNIAKSNHYGNSSFVNTVGNMKYPKSVLKFDRPHPPIHPTQKPVDLCEYLINTYTDEGDLVLDNCIGSGTTAIACLNTRRNFIGFENDPKYYEICLKRLAESQRGG